MPAIQVTAQDGSRHRFEVPHGKVLMEPLRDAQLVDAVCGGAASCGTCHIYLGEAFLAAAGPRREEEEWMLEGLEGVVAVKNTSRLACQIEMSEALDGAALEIAPQI